MLRGKRDLRQRAQHVLGIRREHTRFLQRIQRAGRVTFPGLHPRQQQKRLNRLEAIRSGAQQLLRFSAMAGGGCRGGTLDQGVAARARRRL